MTLMGGPIDTRCSPTAVNKLAEERGTEWFRENCLETVPFPYPGMGRRVYPGYLQLSGFMAMNMDRHVKAHTDMFHHLVAGDGEPAEKHREFYDEYLAVLDLTAEYYMQTIEQVFVRQSLPKGEFVYAGQTIDLGDIRRTGLMTVEGERDDISGGRPDQCRPAALPQPAGRAEAALFAARRRPLRRVQRLALPRRDRAPDGGVLAPGRDGGPGGGGLTGTSGSPSPLTRPRFAPAPSRASGRRALRTVPMRGFGVDGTRRDVGVPARTRLDWAACSGCVPPSRAVPKAPERGPAPVLEVVHDGVTHRVVGQARSPRPGASRCASGPPTARPC